MVRHDFAEESPVGGVDFMRSSNMFMEDESLPALSSERLAIRDTHPTARMYSDSIRPVPFEQAPSQYINLSLRPFFQLK
jgi:hypothetical protein